ncbi:MAG: hypothetical protein ACK4UU_02875, partial [Fimbriimonadales bacterium]
MSHRMYYTATCSLSIIFIAIAVLGASCKTARTSAHTSSRWASRCCAECADAADGLLCGAAVPLAAHQAITVSIEGGIQNGTLAIFIANT